MSGPAIRLKRMKAGKYVTLDGRFEVVKDPSNWGYTSWLIFDTRQDDPDPINIGRLAGTLREARDQVLTAYAQEE